jgi:excisionase family DNA binding protein
MSDQIAPRWGSIDEAAAHLSVSRDTLRRMISRGEIRADRFGKRLIRVDLNALDAAGKPLARGAA